MLQPTHHSTNKSILEEAASIANLDQFKFALNQPSGDFFYDPWVIKPELKNTVWEEILSSLPVAQGEARIIVLKPGTSYYCHADADDRWHLNIQSNRSYLCDITNNIMHPLIRDGVWYEMDAGLLHTAANFGNTDRIQLVVRQLLKRNQLANPITVSISVKTNTPDFRYHFDSTVSSWLNRANKTGVIANFKFVDNCVTVDIEKDHIESLVQVVPDIFEIVL